MFMFLGMISERFFPGWGLGLHYCGGGVGRSHVDRTLVQLHCSKHFQNIGPQYLCVHDRQCVRDLVTALFEACPKNHNVVKKSYSDAVVGI